MRLNLSYCNRRTAKLLQNVAGGQENNCAGVPKAVYSMRLSGAETEVLVKHSREDVHGEAKTIWDLDARAKRRRDDCCTGAGDCADGRHNRGGARAKLPATLHLQRWG